MGAARRRSRGHGPARLDGTRPRATVASKVMESGKMAGQATATSTADRTASEARKPEAGSRAGGVSRAERGNDGSPTGARRRRRLDAQRARQRDRPCFLAGDARTSRLDAQAHALVIGKQVRQRLPWSGRSGAASSAVFEGCQASRGGDSPQDFPLEASEARSAPQGASRYHAESSERRLDSDTGIHGDDESSR